MVDANLQGIEVRESILLAQFSTLKVGGPARYFVTPKTPEQVAFVQVLAKEHGMPIHVVSGGSNTLFSDAGFDGIVMKLSPQFDFIEPQSNRLAMTVGAAASFAKTTKLALLWGWRSALGWCGTPGLIGGAVRMNAGTRMGEISDAVQRVYGVADGKTIVYEKEDIEFGYRSNSLPSDLIIYQVDLAYDETRIENIDELNIKVQEYRQKRKQTQPTINSLGSFFKNPYPHFAAQLIEKCNLKGLEYKGAQISPLHANFLVNNGGATADDILNIASVAQLRVLDQFGILLTPEVRMVGVFERVLQSSVLVETRGNPVENSLSSHR